MIGSKIAILGLGRSGLAVAQAATAMGKQVVVLDEKPRKALKNLEALAEIESLGITVSFDWDGKIADTGADTLVVNPAIDHRSPRLRNAAKSGIDVISEVEFAFRIAKAPIVAITGTNGKSTTTVMTYLALRACEIDAKLCGNIYGSGYPEVPLTEAAHQSNSAQVLVAEVSSFQLEWVKEFHPIVTTITNISPDHLDRYDDFEQYAEAKRRIFARQTVDDYAVICADSTEVRPWENGPAILTYGKCGVQARLGESQLSVGPHSVAFDKLPFQEPHNRLNACAAALMAAGALRHRAGLRGVAQFSPPEAILEGLASFRALDYRMQFVGERDGVRIVNNSMCTNPAAVVASSKSVGGRVFVLMGGDAKGLDFGPVRDFLRLSGTRAYLYGRDGPKIDATLGGARAVCTTMGEAFEAAASDATAGDTILLAPGCASTDQFRDFRDRGDVFTGIAKEWLSR